MKVNNIRRFDSRREQPRHKPPINYVSGCWQEFTIFSFLHGISALEVLSIYPLRCIMPRTPCTKYICTSEVSSQTPKAVILLHMAPECLSSMIELLFQYHTYVHLHELLDRTALRILPYVTCYAGNCSLAKPLW